MELHVETLGLVRLAAKKMMLFLPHAIRQMSAPGRMISPADVHHVITTGEVIEDYIHDPRGHSCLLLGQGVDNRWIHVVCAPKEEFLAIITAYTPGTAEWNLDFKERRKS